MKGTGRSFVIVVPDDLQPIANVVAALLFRHHFPNPGIIERDSPFELPFRLDPLIKKLLGDLEDEIFEEFTREPFRLFSILKIIRRAKKVLDKVFSAHNFIEEALHGRPSPSVWQPWEDFYFRMATVILGGLAAAYARPQNRGPRADRKAFCRPLPRVESPRSVAVRKSQLRAFAKEILR